MRTRRIVPDAGTAVRLSAIERAAFAGRERPWRINDYIALGQSRGSAVFADAAILEGYIILSFAADEAEIINLGVVPSARRQGLARALLDAGLAEARERRVRSVFLEVAEDNDAARALYQGAGFVEVGRRAAYYLRPDGARTDALVLSVDLTDAA